MFQALKHSRGESRVVASYAYVYVGADAARNFDIGMDALTWG